MNKMKRRNWHRTRLLRLLEVNGGYRDAGDHFLLEWNLPVYGVKYFDALVRDALVEHAEMPEGVVPVWKAAYKVELEAYEKYFDSGYDYWSRITEDMWDMFKEDEHWMMHPKTDEKYSCAWELHGRQGKHLVLANFEGYDITGECAWFLGMSEGQGADETSITNKQCAALADMIEFWNQHFTQEAVTKEYEYQLAYRMYNDFHERGWV